MHIQEFTERVKSFMPQKEIERYSIDFEPAYMNAETLSKDEFCALLKNEKIRALVASLSKAIGRSESDLLKMRQTAAQYKSMIDMSNEKIAALKSALRVISANVDRALES